MVTAFAAILAGLVLLVWSADKFVEGAAATARHFGMPSLLIGMLIVGFGTSVPEMLVSAQSAMAGNPGIALGNAYGSNIANIGLILGISVLICPVTVSPQVMRRELPLLMGVSILSMALLWNDELSRLDAVVLLSVFFFLVGWSIVQALRARGETLGVQVDEELRAQASLPLSKAAGLLVLGLAVLIISSRLLVWGAVTVASAMGVSDLVIGLTVVAVGTSLPELASSVAAALKKEHDIALGNVIGSNMFNTLAVVGIAGSIHPMDVEPAVLSRDMPVMLGMTALLFVLGLSRKGREGRINRLEGTLLLVIYAAYTGWLVVGALV